MKKIFLAITVLYLLCEVIYNIGLVEFLSSKNTEISVYNQLEDFGKFLSSVGLTLLLTKLFPSSKQKVVAATILVPFLFVAQTMGFNYLVDNLSKESKVSAYYLGVYRNTVLNGTIENRELKVLTPYNRVVLANIGIYGSDGDIRKSVDGLLFSGASANEISGLYENYKNLSESIGPYYAVYALESKKVEGYKGKVAEEVERRFKLRSKGIAPGLSKAGFFKALGGQSASVAKFNNTVFIPANSSLGIKGLKGADLPLGLDREGFSKFFSDQVSEVINKSKITGNNIDALPHSRELISSVVIPPIAIFLSLASIVLNLCVVLMAVRKELAVLPILAVCLGAYMATSNPYGLNGLSNRAISVEGYFYTGLSGLAKGIHAMFINDKNPNNMDIIVIKKPEIINFGDLQAQMSEMKAGEDMPAVDTHIKVDEEKLEKNANYFGELKTKSNPYAD